MNKRIRMIAAGLFTACALSLTAPGGGMCAYASSAKIAFSDPSATVGQEFQVNVKITSDDGNLGASDLMLSYDPATIEFVGGNNASGGAGSVRLVGTMDSSTTKEFSYTLKFKAIQAGDTSISVGNYEIYDVDAQAVTVSKVGSSAVKVKAPATYSSEAGLSSLKVSPGQLSPAFSPDVTSYTVQVGGNVDKLAVSATAKDGKAKVRVNGDSGLKTGANSVTCKVTAEDGQTTKTYTITVNKLESEEVPSEAASEAETGAAVLGNQTVELDGVTYTVASSFDPAALPQGYTQSSCTYGESEIMCGTGNDLTLIYLQSGDGTGNFFIYVPESGALSPYVTIDVTAKSVLVLPPDDSVAIPDGFVSTLIQLNGNYKVQGWVWQSDEEQKYCVIYGMNENGEKGLYRYDINEKTFQRYFEDPALKSHYDDAQVEELVNTYNELCKAYNVRMIIIIALGVACVLLLFMVINLLLRKKEQKEDWMDAGKREARSPEQRRAESHAAAQTAAAGAERQETGRRGRQEAAGPDRRSPGLDRAPEHGRRDMVNRDRVREESYRESKNWSRLPEESYREARSRDRAPEESYREARSRDRAPEESYRESGNRSRVREESYRESKNRSRVPEETLRREINRELPGRTPRGNASGYEREDGRYGAPERAQARYDAAGRRIRESAGDLYRTAEWEHRPNYDAGMEEVILQREMERAKRAREARERLERERREDERRRMARREAEYGESRKNAGDDEFDDFEMIDLN